MTDEETREERDPEGEKCDVCGKRHLVIFQVPDVIWQNIHPEAPAGMLCFMCCEAGARELGIRLYWEAEVGQFPTERAKAETERLREKQKRPDEVGRTAHPDDERSWAPAYYAHPDVLQDARAALKKAGIEAELLRIEIEALGSKLLDVQQGCVKAKAKAREGPRRGGEKIAKEAKRLAYEVMGGSLGLAKAYCERLDESAEKILTGEERKK